MDKTIKRFTDKYKGRLGGGKLATNSKTEEKFVEDTIQLINSAVEECAKIAETTYEDTTFFDIRFTDAGNTIAKAIRDR